MTRKIPAPTSVEEIFYTSQGYDYIIGADEVGRGAFAGPVVTAAVILPSAFPRKGEIHDSKLLTPTKRAELSLIIKKHALFYSITAVSHTDINTFGITDATIKAFRMAVGEIIAKSGSQNVFVLIDGAAIPSLPIVGITHQKAIIKGDQKSVSIAAASIIAKVHRDQLMTDYHITYPEYGFHIHKGYGTKHHQTKIHEFGLSPIHRTSFALSKFL